MSDFDINVAIKDAIASGALADDVQFAGNAVFQGTPGKWSSQVIAAVATAGNIRA